jgi:hypothetical protein
MYFFPHYFIGAEVGDGKVWPSLELFGVELVYLPSGVGKCLLRRRSSTRDFCVEAVMEVLEMLDVL